jgi:chemotaxis protein MotA
VGDLPTNPTATPELKSGELRPIVVSMDILTLVGLVLALAAIVGGSVLKGAGVAGLVSGAAFLIVIVGTLAAILVQTPLATFQRALRLLAWIFVPPSHDDEGLIRNVIEWSNTARKQGLLGLELQLEAQRDPFVRKGLQMLVDGAEPDAIRATMEIEIDAIEHHDQAAAKVFESMGIYAPTMGLIGAVLGLMAVMQNLADPSKLGTGIAAAFTATIYGIASANLVFLPAANKLKAAIGHQSRGREMMLEGLVAIARGENPRNIESKLQGFLR